MTPLVTVENLTVKYGKHKAFSKISFVANRGDYIGIAGPNGSGKTTLIKALLGLLPIAEGEITYHGKESKKRFIGYLPQKSIQSDNLFPATVREVVAMGLLASKRGPRFFNPADNEKVFRILERLGIDDLANNKVGSLSGGQQQRVLLARALVGSPCMLILDEPTSALDPQIRDNFYELLDQLNKKDGVTILLVTHDMASIGRYTQKLLYLDKRLVFYGNYEEFCASETMGNYFGTLSQHQFCWRHSRDVL
jgi:zinc transport system ATP-binding protein